MAVSDSPLHGDMAQRVAVDTRTLEWTRAPGSQVWRKRLHRVGPAEAGQVTSLVRYAPGARFRAHAHPAGEEILVLEGHFCDEQAVSGPGVYLLHPEGFEHTPYSEDGCLLFVKLRQYAGEGREYIMRDTEAMEWQRGMEDGVSVKLLYEDARFPDATHLERWHPGAELDRRAYPAGAELLVLAGGFADEHGEYGTGVWIRMPPGEAHTPSSEAGCRLYVKTGGVAQLDSTG